MGRDEPSAKMRPAPVARAVAAKAVVRKKTRRGKAVFTRLPFFLFMGRIVDQNND
jgi:hypothetical protein